MRYMVSCSKLAAHAHLWIQHSILLMYFNTGAGQLTCKCGSYRNANKTEFPKIGMSTFYSTDASVKIFVSILVGLYAYSQIA